MMMNHGEEMKKLKAHQPRNGPETRRLNETKFGKFTKLSTNPPPSLNSLTWASLCLLPSSVFRIPNLIGNPTLAFWSSLKASTVRGKTTSPWTRSGVADWESFHGVEERKRGPWKTMRSERGERKREWGKGGERKGLRERGEKTGGLEEEERENEVRNGRGLSVLGRLIIRCRDLKIAIDVGAQFNKIGLVRLRSGEKNRNDENLREVFKWF